jgi:hypothetical protein
MSRHALIVFESLFLEKASNISRIIAAHPSRFLREFFKTSRRIPEAASRILEETSKDLRLKYGGCPP